MKGVWRLAIAVGTGALALAPAPLAAQSTPGATSNTPATDAVGPRELQNFSLSGNVTHPADQPAAPATRSQPSTQSVTQETPSASGANRRARVAEQQRPERPVAVTPTPIPQPAPRPVVAPTDAPALSKTESPIAAAATALPPPSFGSPAKAEPPAAPDGIQPEHHLLLWPWLIGVLFAAIVGAFFLLRGRSRRAFAGGTGLDLFAAPESAPQQAPRAPQPKPTPPSAPRPEAKSLPAGGVVSTGLRHTGVVSTSLRPWLDVAIQPLRCIVDESKVTIEFELELYNSGTAAARAILVEAMAFNAGPTQDQEIGAFFDKPTGEGDRIDAIPPLQRISLRTQVVAPRENVIVLDAGGRQVFVPLIAFNALYGWNGREGQTSVSYLLGRETDAEKMAPFRVDLGPRQYRKVGAHPLPTGIRK